MVNLVQQAMHGTSIPSKYDGKSDENMTNLLFFNLAWLSNVNDIKVKFFKVIYLGPWGSD